MLDAFVAAEGEPESVQLSGGEPSIHPQILEMLAAAKARGIPLVMLNTNGIRLARDPRFAPALAEIGVHVYLQFDGFDAATHRRSVAGPDGGEAAGARPLRRGRRQRLARGGDRARHQRARGRRDPAFRRRASRGDRRLLSARHALGRFRIDSDPLDKLTNPDVIAAIAEQLPDWFRAGRLRPGALLLADLPLGDLALYDGEDLIPLPRLVDVEDYLDYVTNRAVPDLEVREALEGLWSAKAAGGQRP